MIQLTPITIDEMNVWIFSIEVILLLIISFAMLIKMPNPNSTYTKPSNFFTPKFKINFTSNSNKSIDISIKQSISLYISSCLGYDYLRPKSHSCSKGTELGITAIDSLDTLLLISAQNESNQIIDWIKNDFTCQVDFNIPLDVLFGHIIGGLISAYSITNDNIYLEKAEQCALLGLKSFESSIPSPFIHGKRKQPLNSVWIPGTTLSDASSGLLELEFFAKNINNLINSNDFKQVSSKLTSFYSCISNYIRQYNNLPSFWSVNECKPLPEYENIHFPKLSPFNSRFFSNILRSQLLNPTSDKKAIIDWLVNQFEVSTLRSITDGHFESIYCDMVPLLSQFPEYKDMKITQKLNKKCQEAADDILPISSGMMQRNFLDVEDSSFKYSTALLENSLLNDGTLDSVYFLNQINNAFCNKKKTVFCGIQQQNPLIHSDFMPSEAISKFGKFLVLEGTKLDYHSYVFNEFGHIIPFHV